MNTRALLRTLALSVVSVALAATPQLAFARGGGHGGGGAHFGGGGFHGGGFGGFRGGSVGTFRGGYGGFRGGFAGNGGYGYYGGRGFYGGRGYWGYPGWGWGLNVGIGLGYWGYPYWYGAWGPYGPYAYASPDYPYYYDPYYDGDYRCPPDRYQDERNCTAPNNQPNNPPRNAPNNPPPQPSSMPAPQGFRQNNVNTSYAGYGTPPLREGSGNYRLASYTEPLPSNLRPAVRNVIEALRAMPPAARERQLNSGRYDGFSSQERELVSQFAQTQ